MKFSHAGFISIILAATLWTTNAHADNTDVVAENPPQSTANKTVVVSIMTGVHSFAQIGMMGALPLPASAAVSVDIHHLRLRADMGYYIGGLFHGTVDGGVLLTPIGKQAAHKGGFQLKLPLTLAAGVIVGTVEAQDGYDDHVKWLVAGPNLGADFTWWKADRLGFNLSIKAGYLFRADIGSSFPDGYSSTEDEIGTLDLSFMLGVSI